MRYPLQVGQYRKDRTNDSPSLFPDVDLPETLRKRVLEEEETGSVRNDKDA
jgi:hypothetical protein